ncbi:hypothetical protein AU255_10060 [Methyloprofundus sedimenti]|uniref:Uncharacterized protein n=2 Tax=Methyloprofundus sedimenti TaxID=1420851 RepID=A0A1V8M9F3_9GAMM|nr:hypothetical protein AU255_10060 [Methyloprofundus sedimenti]
MLSACGGNTVTKSPVILDAESDMNNGLQAFADADWSSAQSFFSRALSLYEGIDSQKGILYSHINLAEVGLSVGNYQATQLHLERAGIIAKNVEFQDYQPRITLLLAQSILQQQDYVQAEKILQALLPEFNELIPVNTPDTIQLTAIASRTRIAFAQQQDESKWTQRYAQALTKSDSNSVALESRLLRFQAELLRREQHFRDAESHLQRALTGYKAISSRADIAATLAELGCLSAQGHWQDAQGYFIRSNKVFSYIGDIDAIINNTKLLIRVELQLGNLERCNSLTKRLTEIQKEHLQEVEK